MPEILKSLPPAALFTVIIVALVLGIIGTIIIALRGKLGIKIGNKSISLGGGEGDKGKDKPKLTTDTPPVTVFQKRSCGDCVLLLMGEREKLEFKTRHETEKIMKNQMTFAEQKLIEVQTKVTDHLSRIIRESIEDGTTTVEESVQYKLTYGLLKDALLNIKDEIRRSFKDNGFYDLSGSEFSWYVKERTQVLSSMLTQYMRNVYPDRGGVLQLFKIQETLEKESTFLAGIINDIYSYAREVKIECSDKVKVMRTLFSEWVDVFTNPK